MALQACMDSSDWLQGTVHEDESGGMDSTSGAGHGACSRPMMERKLKPPQDQAQKCPRCDSAHTKFCYYNNYSLTQPRYFCKTCRRYWTQGGTLRNIPVGGVCRRNTHKKHVAKKSSSSNSNDFGTVPANSINPADLHLSSLFGAHHNILSNNISPNMFDADRYNAVDFTDTKQLAEASRNYDFMGQNMDAPSFAGPFGMMGLEHGNNVSVHGTSGFMDSYRRMMLPYDGAVVEDQRNVDVKPELVGIDHQWQEQGYLNNIGTWSGMMNTYGPSPANPLAYLITKL